MAKLTVISDSLSGSVLAACSAADGKSGEAGLAELIGSALLLAVGVRDVELVAAGLAADTVPYTDLESVIRDPKAFWVKRISVPLGPEQVSLEPVAGDAALDLTVSPVELSVPTPVGEPRRASLLVQRGTQAPQRIDGTIQINTASTTFAVTIATGDLVIALAAGHRPVLTVKS